MKKIILGLKKDQQIYAFVALGLILILFPEQIAAAVPYIVGVFLLLYAALNMFVSLKYPDSRANFGKALVGIVLGAAILLQKSDAIGTIGVIWAVRSLYEAADELNEMRETRKLHILSLIGLIVSAILALLLILDPFEHFTMHVRILGLEILSSAFIRRRKGMKAFSLPDAATENREKSL